MTSSHSPDDFAVNPNIKFNCGFNLSTADFVLAVIDCNRGLASLPPSLWNQLALKLSGAIIGTFLSTSVAAVAKALVNPIEKGHPDVLPQSAKDATEEQLRNYPEGLEIKGTCGNLPAGQSLRPGIRRCEQLIAITWQAHHREVKSLLGCIWDFDTVAGDHPAPFISAAFYCDSLTEDDWGKISGTTGRNTKVTGMCASGKRKMAAGAICILNREPYLSKYSKILSGFPPLETA
jgi:hypothetical protein